MDTRLPSRWLHTDVVYRMLGAGGDDTVLGCGFMLKPDGWDVFRRAHGHYSAVLVLRGRGSYHDAAGREWELQPGTVFQRFPDAPHSLRIASGGAWAECWFALGRSLFTGLVACAVIDPRRPVLVAGIDHVLLCDLTKARDELRQAPVEQLPQCLAHLLGLFTRLLASGYEPARSREGDAIDHACRRLGNDPRADLEELARAHGLDYGRFRKQFKLRTGLSPGAFRICQRINRAREHLLGSDRPIHVIANDLGYSDAFAFSAQFRKVVGMSPSAYRRCR